LPQKLPSNGGDLEQPQEPRLEEKPEDVSQQTGQAQDKTTQVQGPEPQEQEQDKKTQEQEFKRRRAELEKAQAETNSMYWAKRREQEKEEKERKSDNKEDKQEQEQDKEAPEQAAQSEQDRKAQEERRRADLAKKAQWQKDVPSKPALTAPKGNWPPPPPPPARVVSGTKADQEADVIVIECPPAKRPRTAGGDHGTSTSSKTHPASYGSDAGSKPRHGSDSWWLKQVESNASTEPKAADNTRDMQQGWTTFFSSYQKQYKQCHHCPGLRTSFCHVLWKVFFWHSRLWTCSCVLLCSECNYVHTDTQCQQPLLPSRHFVFFSYTYICTYFCAHVRMRYKRCLECKFLACWSVLFRCDWFCKCRDWQ
jgi:hypothetical protein